MMSRKHPLHPELRRVLAVLLALSFISCDGDQAGTGPNSSSNVYEGVLLASDGSVASLRLTIEPAPIGVTGLISMRAGMVQLAGSLTDGALSLAGGGYTLQGTVRRGSATGTFDQQGQGNSPLRSRLPATRPSISRGRSRTIDWRSEGATPLAPVAQF
jgi:hypothetical protein